MNEPRDATTAELRVEPSIVLEALAAGEMGATALTARLAADELAHRVEMRDKDAFEAAWAERFPTVNEALREVYRRRPSRLGRRRQTGGTA